MEDGFTKESKFKILRPEQETEGTYVSNYPFGVEAKEKELKNFNKFNVYEEVKPRT